MRPEPTVLAFDTSAAHCAAALLIGDKIVETRVDEMGKGQAEHLMPMLSALMDDHELTFGDLDGIGVGTGPGNFTGIRIAVSAARGLALGLGVPAVGVSGFEALSYQLSRPVTAFIPAPRGQAYVQRFTEGDEEAPRLIVVEDELVEGPIAPVLSAAVHVATIARIAAAGLDTVTARPAPLYVRAADAAPPRDPAPTILP